MLLSTATFGFVLKGFRDEGQPFNGVSPVFEVIIIIIHVLEFKQMSNGPGDDDVVAVPVCFGFFTDAQYVGKVLGNTWFLSNDDDGHV